MPSWKPLLGIVGEDRQNVARKYKDTLAGVKLPVKFTIIGNEPPRLRDGSDALMSRILLLQTTRSFVDKEDRKLFQKLKAELPGVLNWSIAGWGRLQGRGGFRQPSASRDLLEALSEATNPVRAFVTELCDVGPGYCETATALFDAWAKWCHVHHRDHLGTRQSFGMNLRMACPSVKGRKWGRR